MKLILVRHGDIASEGPGVCYGVTDVPLSEKGLSQAVALRQRFETEGIDAFYSGTLQRSKQTAEIITRVHRKNVITDIAINEVDFGAIERKTYEQVAREYPDIAGLWLSGSTQISFPGGEHFQGLVERATRFISEISARHNQDDTIMIVSHGGPLRVMICHLLGLPMNHHWQLNIERASVSIIRSAGDQAVLDCLNDMSHWNEIEVTE